MSIRKELEKLGLDYKVLAGYFGYKKPVAFSSSSARKRIEAGVWRVVEHVRKTGIEKLEK